jgi:hypothetical protein
LERRSLLRLMALTPISAIAAACGGAALKAAGTGEGQPDIRVSVSETEPELTPPSAPPFVLPEGEEKRLLMAGTRYETPLYVFASGRPGRIALALGGVHGNEPGGWLAAERVVDNVRPANGAVLVIPRANKVAISMGERTTDDLADLNRSYPGFEDGKPMERLATEIMNAIRDFHVDLVHDMHESWSFYKDRSTNGTAFLGQTVSTNGEAGTALVESVIARVNPTVQHSREEFSFREFGGNPNQQPTNLPRQQDIPPQGRGTSSLGLSRLIPGLVPILVEMGQQQTLERRTALHVRLFQEVLSQLGIT